MDAPAFIKVLADWRWGNLGKCRPVFQEKGVEFSKWTKAPINRLKELLTNAGHQPSEEDLAEVERQANTVQGMIDWREFLRLEKVFRQTILEMFKENLGFTHEQKTKLELDFRACANEVAEISGKHLIDIVIKRFPDLAQLQGQELVTDLRDLVQQSTSQSQSGKGISMKGYLWIMRRVTDRKVNSLLRQQQLLRNKLNFSKEEVSQFREVFNIADEDHSGSICFKELRSLFSQMVPLLGDAVFELSKLFAQVDDNGDAELDFHEFLRLMRMLLDHNWRNVVGVAGAKAFAPASR